MSHIHSSSLCSEGTRAPSQCDPSYHCLVQCCAEGQHPGCCTCCSSRVLMTRVSWPASCILSPVSVYGHGSAWCRRELLGGAGSRHGRSCAAGLEPAPVLQLQPPVLAEQPGCSGMGLPEHPPSICCAERHQLQVSALPACSPPCNSALQLRGLCQGPAPVIVSACVCGQGCLVPGSCFLAARCLLTWLLCFGLS